MAVLRPLGDEEVSAEALAIFAEIRAARQTEFINNFWRVLAHDPALLRATWDRLAVVMGPGNLDPMVKEMIYLAVSAANGCSYCVHSHTAAAKAKGMTEAQHGELLSVIAMASQTNALANALQIPVDEQFLAGG
jgi:AhpD family alkylhydroperoxidase